MNNKYAIIKLGGKQFKVHEGDIFKIERQDGLKLEVLAYSNGEGIILGTPTLSDVTVSASVIKEQLGPKVKINRFKAKSRYRRAKGHRQPLSIVKIDDILMAGEKSTKKEKTVAPKEESQKETKPAKVAKEKKTVKAEKAPVKSVKKVVKKKE